MSSISSGTTLTTALVQTADTSGVLQLQTNGGTTALTLDTSQNATFAGKVASASSLQLATNGTTTAVTIDTNQNVGLGVTPSAWRSGTKALQISSYTNLSSDNSNAALQLTSNAYNNGTNWIYENNGYANSYQNYQGQHLWYNAPSGTAGNAITFTQAMTLDASGKLLVGLTSATSFVSNLIVNRQNVTNSPIFTWTNGINNSGHTYIFSNGTGNGAGVSADGYLAFGSNEGGAGTFTERVRIDTSGNSLIGYTSSNGSYKLQVNSQIFATSSTIATSDARYKENVEELSGALDIVKALRPVSFNWKAHPIHNFDTTTKTVGFLAQDVQQTLAGKPYLNSIIKTNECVIEPEVKDKNGNVTKEAVTEEFLGIAEGNMISILTAAIQELSAQVTTLQTQVTALKG
jgi:hypothetical protein